MGTLGVGLGVSQDNEHITQHVALDTTDLPCTVTVPGFHRICGATLSSIGGAKLHIGLYHVSCID
jgi:hypothetical protein